MNYLKYSTIIGIIFSLLIFTICLYFFKDTDPDIFGMGRNTTSHKSYFIGNPVSQHHGNTNLVRNSFDELENLLPNTKKVFFLGNSQLHAINYFEKGDKLFLDYFNDNVKSKKLNYIGFCLSSPHLSVKEMLAYYEIIRSDDIHPSILFLSLSFRSFQKPQIRQEIMTQLAEINLESDFLDSSITQNNMVNKNLNLDKEKSMQESFEEYLISKLKRQWPYFSYRENLKKLFESYSLGTIFRILKGKSSNLVKGSKIDFEQNLSALKNIIRLSISDNTHVILYIPPMPQSKNISPAYDDKEYQNFKKNIKLLSNQFLNISYFDIEKTIPIDFWGESNTGAIDLFHFKDEGHRILGEELVEMLEKVKINAL
jgi:hypothetical protein